MKDRNFLRRAREQKVRLKDGTDRWSLAIAKAKAK
jgi:hypothetical protein